MLGSQPQTRDWQSSAASAAQALELHPGQFAQAQRSDDVGVDASETTHAERRWAETVHAMLRLQPHKVPYLLPGAGPCRRAVFNLVHSQRFERLCLSVVLVNTLLMACDGHDTPWATSERAAHYMDRLNSVCVLIFTLELFAKVSLSLLEARESALNFLRSRLDLVLALADSNQRNSLGKHSEFSESLDW